MTDTLRRIGIFGEAPSETSHRSFAGALGYLDETGGFLVRDFCVRGLSGNVCDTRPPWTGQADGLIVCIGRDEGKTDKDMADWVLRGGVPAVAVGSDWIDPRVPCFHVSSRSLAELAAEHLMACGCRSFLFFGFAGAAGSLKRSRGFKESLQARGQKLVEHATTLRCMGTLADLASLRAEKGLIEQLRKLPKPLGVWALNDHFAASLCVLCEELDLRVPEMVKVLGVDDVSIARVHRPSLSSIRTPGEQVGRLAMRALHQMLNGRARPRSPTEVPAVELVERESTSGMRLTHVDFADVVEYIARHACANLTVEHLAETMNISRRSFELRFLASVGRTPRDEIQRVRLQRAEDLLRQTQLSVSRIASMVGFAETAAFSKFFRNHRGISPRGFRDGPSQRRKQS